MADYDFLITDYLESLLMQLFCLCAMTFFSYWLCAKARHYQKCKWKSSIIHMKGRDILTFLSTFLFFKCILTYWPTCLLCSDIHFQKLETELFLTHQMSKSNLKSTNGVSAANVSWLVPNAQFLLIWWKLHSCMFCLHMRKFNFEVNGFW